MNNIQAGKIGLARSSKLKAQRLFLSLILLSAFSFQLSAKAAYADTWRPIIGIPQPDFGIEESHLMYADPQYTYDYGSGPQAYRDAGNGPYTHYVDNTHLQATDAANPLGSPQLPRRTIPQSLVAGSVVEIHGGSYSYANPIPITGVGSPDKPIFVRGGDTNSKPTFPGPKIRVAGSYIIVENLNLDGASAAFQVLAASGSINHHITLRHSLIHNTVEASAVAIEGYVNEADAIVHHIVIYDNEIYDMGDWQAPTQWDRHCVGVLKNSKYVWIVDNKLHHNQGDGVAVNWYGRQDQQVPPQYVYIGRNEIHHNHENALDFKCPRDVIASENKMYTIRAVADASDDGTIVVVHNDEATAAYPYPDNIWFLFNEFYDSEGGIRCNNIHDLGIANSRTYIIGNTFHDIFAISVALRQNNLWSMGTAIRVQNRAQVTAVNNVIYNTDLGIYGALAGSLLNTANNIISGLSGNYYALFGVEPIHLMVTDSAAANASRMNNNLLYNNGDQTPIRWAGTLYNDISAFQAATGKGAGCVDEAPLLDANYKPQAASPAIDSGALSSIYDTFETLYGIDIKKDFDGNPRPYNGLWDIGAFEYGLSPRPRTIINHAAVDMFDDIPQPESFSEFDLKRVA